MSSKKLLLLFLVVPSLAGVFPAGLAAAQEAQENEAYPAVYFGIAFATGIDQFDDTGGFSSFDEALGVDLWVGIRANRYLGVEGELVYLEGFDTEFRDVPIDFEALGFTANLKLYPLEGWAQPYLLGGVGVGRFEAKALGRSIDESDAIFVLGGGVDLYFYHGFAAVLGAGYVFTTGDIKDTDFVEIKVGIQHKF